MATGSKKEAVLIRGFQPTTKHVPPDPPKTQSLAGKVFIWGLHIQGWYMEGGKANLLPASEAYGIRPGVLIDKCEGGLIHGAYLEPIDGMIHSDGVVVKNSGNVVVQNVRVTGKSGPGPALTRAYRILDSSGCFLRQVFARGEHIEKDGVAITPEFEKVYVNVRTTQGALVPESTNIVDAWTASATGPSELPTVGSSKALRFTYTYERDLL
jgi:hypothetical protein